MFRPILLTHQNELHGAAETGRGCFVLIRPAIVGELDDWEAVIVELIHRHFEDLGD